MTNTKLPYSIQPGLDGKLYAVFADNYARDTYTGPYPVGYKAGQPASFGQFDNAYQLDKIEENNK